MNASELQVAAPKLPPARSMACVSLSTGAVWSHFRGMFPSRGSTGTTSPSWGPPLSARQAVHNHKYVR